LRLTPSSAGFRAASGSGNDVFEGDLAPHRFGQADRLRRVLTVSSACSSSTSRSVAPEARCNSPQISDSAPTEPPTMIA
jgi:hypothetical protein